MVMLAGFLVETIRVARLFLWTGVSVPGGM
jgi:hypothetical protein